MSIQTPEIATAYGALDSSAFADGAPFGAHALRAMIRSVNRLTSKGQHLVTLLWPKQITDATEAGSASFGMCSAKAWPWWSRYLLPITVPKRPGLNFGDVRVNVKVSDGFKVFLAFETKPIGALQGTLSLNHPNVLELTGTGSYADASLDSILIDASDYDVLAVWVQGVPQYVDLTATYGSPRTGTIDVPSDIVTPSTLIDQAANWNTTLAFPSSRDYASDGHVIQFADGLIAPRAILNIDSPVGMTFGPPLEQQEVARAMADGSYKILRCPQVSIATLSLAARARS